jgi:hypothetical protein
MTNPFKGFFSKLRAALFNFLNGPGGAILAAAAESLVKEIGAAASSVLLEQAQKYVSSIDATPGRGSIKAANAQEYLADYATKVGINASRSLINFAVESAVRSLRAGEQ